jgi:excisionase family DNA binding protein
MTVRATQQERPYLTVGQLAARYGVSVGAVRDWRRNGTGPIVTKVGGLVRFALADVLAWEQSRREASA